jgi:hypothetical protein
MWGFNLQDHMYIVERHIDELSPLSRPVTCWWINEQ